MLSDNLQAFVGKVCTVLTFTTPLILKDAVQHAQYFTGEVTSVDDYGVWVRHPQTKTMSFFQFPLVGIVEEQYISPSDPMMEKIKEDMAKKKEVKKETPRVNSGSNTFIPIDDLTNMIRRPKKD